MVKALEKTNTSFVRLLLVNSYSQLRWSYSTSSVHNATFSFSGAASTGRGLTVYLLVQAIALVVRMAANPEKTRRPKCLMELLMMFEPRVWKKDPAPHHFKRCMLVFPWRVKKKDKHQSSSSARCWKGRSAELSRFTDLQRSIACQGMPHLTSERAALHLSLPSPSTMAEYDESGYTALHYAAAEGDVGTATYLLQNAGSLTVDTSVCQPGKIQRLISVW